ncbi:MAG: hypothetical protein IPJ32_00155 [Sphingobacteriaceae bacterium]|nr:hypothetical protein [Sphingobacteriaceae bacterium]
MKKLVEDSKSLNTNGFVEKIDVTRVTLLIIICFRKGKNRTFSWVDGKCFEISNGNGN